MKSIIRNTLAPAMALGALAATVPATAGDQDIVVQSQPAMEQWSRDVTRSLNRQLVNVERLNNAVPRPGIVQVRFTLDENGRASDMTLLRSSGHAGTDSLAQKAVRKLRHLDEAPVRDVRGKLFQANIIYARDGYERDQLADELARSERSRIALGVNEAEVLSFGG